MKTPAFDKLQLPGLSRAVKPRTRQFLNAACRPYTQFRKNAPDQMVGIKECMASVPAHQGGTVEEKLIDWFVRDLIAENKRQRELAGQ